jgi:hypothetical protein
MYYNGRRCVPQPGYERAPGVRVYGSGYYERRYDDPGVRIDLGPGVGVRVR